MPLPMVASSASIPMRGTNSIAAPMNTSAAPATPTGVLHPCILRYTNRYCRNGASKSSPIHPGPLFNEEEFVGTLLHRVLAAPLPEGLSREIIVVDDGSTDGSDQIVEEIASQHPG